MKTTLLFLTLLTPAWAMPPTALQWGWGRNPAQIETLVQQQGWELLRPLHKTEQAGHLSQMTFQLPQAYRGSTSLRTYVFRNNELVRVYLLTQGTGAKKIVSLFNASYRQLTPTVWVDPTNGTRVDQALIDNNQIFTVSPR